MFVVGMVVGFLVALAPMVLALVILDRRAERRDRMLYRYGPMPVPAARNLPGPHDAPRLVTVMPAGAHHGKVITPDE